MTPQRVLLNPTLNKIIKERLPLGLFYAWSNNENVWIAVDNSTGDAWTEEFQSVDFCITFLLRRDLEIDWS